MPNWESFLRNDLAKRAKSFATANGLIYYKSLGDTPTILFPVDPIKSRHGNFNDKSYAAILANPSWAKRLEKPHSQRLRALPKKWQESAKELDSSNSSDALLMNCFCYPDAAGSILGNFLQTKSIGPVEFGVPGKVPLYNGAPDKTELDMRIGKIIFEAKLTESDFTSKNASFVESYRDFHDVFDAEFLPKFEGKYQSYQLIRNVLAAAEHNYELVLICDGRRPDLLRHWWTVYAAIRNSDLKVRCHFLFWQEVAETCLEPLKEYLHAKYGL